jgi:hypothetical protein
VITQHHLPSAQAELVDRPPDTVIVQPCNRDTGPGILLPLWYVQQRDPEALVALFPCRITLVLGSSAAWRWWPRRRPS